MKNRIDFLDGMRGVAILLVIAFHAYTRWTDLVPYGESYAEIPLFHYGWLGVQLFFLISGFVIFMSLERSRSFFHFVKKRWTRLFPAMAVVSMLVYLTFPFFSDGPSNAPTPVDLIPGLTFLDPRWWSAWLGIPVKSLEGPFWTLYVEFKFYIIAALLYFFAGRRFVVPALTGMYLLALAATLFHHLPDFSFLHVLKELSDQASFEHFGWFASGAAFYLYYRTKSPRWLVAAWLVGLAAVAILRDAHSLIPPLYGTSLLTLFGLSMSFAPVQTFLRNPLFLFLGFVSYPLYLIHENAMISLTVKLSRIFPQIPGYLYPWIAIASLLPLTWFIAKHVEPRLKRLLLRVVPPREET